MFDHPLKQYALFKDFEQAVQNRSTPGVPDAFGDNAHAKAYFGAIKMVVSDASDVLVPLAFEIDQVVRDAVAENSLNPQNIGQLSVKVCCQSFSTQSWGWTMPSRSLSRSFISPAWG